MIVFDHNDVFSSLWWAHGSAIPTVGWLSLICAINGVIAVYFKKVFSFYLTSTPHSIIATTVGALLIFKSGLAFYHFSIGTQAVRSYQDSCRKLLIHAHSYGSTSTVSQARDLILSQTNLCRHFSVLFYSLVMHLRRQPVLPASARIYLYLYPQEWRTWQLSKSRPLTCLLWINCDIARLRDKGIIPDSIASMMSDEINELVSSFGIMERIRNTSTIPFIYFQFCNWVVLLFCLTVPATIATYDTSYISAFAFSFLVTFILFGINRIGDHIQEPYGMGPHDLPLERLGKTLEQELYLFFPYFKFRYEAFPLFVDDLQILPPNDLRALRKSSLYAESMKSPWIITRVKMLAVALVIPSGDRPIIPASGTSKPTKYSAKAMKASMDSRETRPSTSAIAPDVTKDTADGMQESEHISAPPSPESVPARMPDAAPAELKQSTLVKQASMLARKFPESLTLQHMLLQISQPKTSVADQRGMLAIMVSEAQMLSKAVDIDLEEA